VERRHRLNRLEILPVKEAVRNQLVELLNSRREQRLAEILFRVWYRLEYHGGADKGRPNYPMFTWATLRYFVGTPMVMVPIIEVVAAE